MACFWDCSWRYRADNEKPRFTRDCLLVRLSDYLLAVWPFMILGPFCWARAVRPPVRP
jgi:hypothetical protein